MKGDAGATPRVRRPVPGAVRTVLVGMGGVVLDLGEGGGLPWGELERRGREELLAAVQEGGGQVSEEDLDRLLFVPWRRGYERRYRLGREAPWYPHLARLRRVAGAQVSAGRLLSAWAGPYLRSLRPTSGAEEALARLAAADLSLALVSNVPMPGGLFEGVLETHGLDVFFQSLHFSYDAGTRKPAPGLVWAALDALGAEADSALLVGDRRSTDVAAGRAAEVATVWIESSDVDGPEPDATIGSLAELPSLLGL